MERRRPEDARWHKRKRHAHCRHRSVSPVTWAVRAPGRRKGASAMSLDLKVIGAGMGRTGTTSLKAALETLLKGPCFHFLEYKSRPELMAPWLSLIQANPLRSDPDKFADVPISQWETVMPGYVACVDEPASYYWKQLSDAFPKALVI
jgi:hypothetical protein